MLATSLGIALVAICALGAAGLIAMAGASQEVVAVSRPVAYGERLTPNDLATSGIDPDSLFDAVPANQLDAMIGKVATTDLAAGSLLTPGQIADEIQPADGMQVIPVPVRNTQLPAGGLRPRDQVLVVATPVTDGEAPEEEPNQFAATVLTVGSPDDTGTRVVDVLAMKDDGPMLAALAATGRVSVVLEPRR